MDIINNIIIIIISLVLVVLIGLYVIIINPSNDCAANWCTPDL